MRSEEILIRTAEAVKESNKILIQELVSDLENKGIMPVWASEEGKVRKLKIASESELKNFQRVVKKFGKEKTDFCLLAEDTDCCDLRKIIVIQKNLGSVKEYQAAHWVSSFTNDLKNKLFG